MRRGRPTKSSYSTLGLEWFPTLGDQELPMNKRPVWMTSITSRPHRLHRHPRDIPWNEIEAQPTRGTYRDPLALFTAPSRHGLLQIITAPGHSAMYDTDFAVVQITPTSCTILTMRDTTRGSQGQKCRMEERSPRSTFRAPQSSPTA